GLAAVGAVFVILVVLAPIIYNLSLRNLPKEGGEQQKQGLVFCYILASVVTLWGVYGGLYVGYLLLNQISWGALTSDRASILFIDLPYAVGIVIALYAVLTMCRTVGEQVRAAEGTTTQEAQFIATRSTRSTFPLL